MRHKHRNTTKEPLFLPDLGRKEVLFRQVCLYGIIDPSRPILSDILLSYRRA